MKIRLFGLRLFNETSNSPVAHTISEFSTDGVGLKKQFVSRFLLNNTERTLDIDQDPRNQGLTTNLNIYKWQVQAFTDTTKLTVSGMNFIVYHLA